MGCALEPGRDVAHCVSLRLAWQELVARFGSLRFDPQPALADALNEPLDAACVERAACAAHAGFGAEGILERIRADLSARFPGTAPSLLPAAIADEGLLAFAYLARQLPFRSAFRAMSCRFQERTVAGFGVDEHGPHGEVLRAQLRVHDFVSAADFVLELLPEPAGERIVVAQVPRQPTLQQAVDHVRARLGRLRGEAAALRADDAFSMPTLAIDAMAQLPELVGRPLCNDAVRGTQLDDVRQGIRFSLDERGARVESQAVLLAYGAPMRAFRVTAPFLLMLLRDGSRTPYLTLWVETPTWMQDRGEAPKPPAGFSFGGGPR
ncbi:MAG: hypothetical protein WKG00_04770 [Polyangiaceae bacterium]